MTNDLAIQIFLAQWLVGFALTMRYFIVSDDVMAEIKPQEGFGEFICAFICALFAGSFINTIFFLYYVWWMCFRAFRSRASC
jgi:hypothetical protein